MRHTTAASNNDSDTDQIAAMHARRLVDKTGLSLERVRAALAPSPPNSLDVEAVTQALDATGWAGGRHVDMLKAWASRGAR